MNPTIEIRIWDWYRLQTVKVEDKIALIFPFVLLKKDATNFPEIGTRAHLNICKNNEHIKMGQADIIGKREAPLGRVTPDIWACHLGPGYEEEYLERIQEVYDLEMPFGRFSYVYVVELKIVHLETGFIALNETKV